MQLCHSQIATLAAQLQKCRRCPQADRQVKRVAEEVVHAWERDLRRLKWLFLTYFLLPLEQIGHLSVPFSVFYLS